jgi:UDPglucose--hexose-1-phosphate uridylyltransferase
MAKDQNPPSQLRQDPVSGDWVVIATQRAKRPDDFFKKEPQKNLAKTPAKECVFCQITSRETPILVQFQGKEVPPTGNWTVAVVNNKYPAFAPNPNLNQQKIGPYQVMNGVGHHELVIFKDHYRRLDQMKTEEILEILEVYQKRYLILSKQAHAKYVAIFHNEGREAGASIDHPHSQIMAIPTLDADIRTSLKGARRFWQKNNHQCPYCAMIEHDLKHQERVIWENKEFIACCPFAPKSAFEIRIYPKKHQSHFEKTNHSQMLSLANTFKTVLTAVRRGLGNPDYNFFLQTAPCDGKKYQYFHWHWQIQPKTQVWGGFELGTEIEISTIPPEDAAKHLRKQITTTRS